MGMILLLYRLLNYSFSELGDYGMFVVDTLPKTFVNIGEQENPNTRSLADQNFFRNCLE